jgi:hypothetical protein
MVHVLAGKMKTETKNASTDFCESLNGFDRPSMQRSVSETPLFFSRHCCVHSPSFKNTHIWVYALAEKFRLFS